MTNRQAWTDNENGALCALYFRMFAPATAGEKYNKAAMIRGAQSEALCTRTRGSIEAKLMNASAAHLHILQDGIETPPHVTMDGFGYRALSNYQKTLRTAMAGALQIFEDEKRNAA